MLSHSYLSCETTDMDRQEVVTLAPGTPWPQLSPATSEAHCKT